MSVIALLTDFGLTDNYVGVMKGVMLTINPAASIVDITHAISSHNIKQGAWVLGQSFSYFPHGTIFVVVVDPGVGSSRKSIAIKTKNYFFAGPDNGILSMAAKKDGIEKIIVLENKHYWLENICSTFHGRDIFAPVAAYLSSGVSVTSLGKKIDEIKQIDFTLPAIKNNEMRAEIIYGDTFGNLVTNIDDQTMQSFLKGKRFIASLNKKKIKTVCGCYSEAKENEPFFILGSSSLWEISLKNKSAKNYFALSGDKGAIVQIERQ